MKRILVLVVMFVMVVSWAEAGKSSKTRNRSSVWPVAAYTLGSCDECATMKSYLRSKGVRLNVVHLSSPVVQNYPTIIYSNNTSDYGERVYGGQCSFPSSMKVWEID